MSQPQKTSLTDLVFHFLVANPHISECSPPASDILSSPVGGQLRTVGLLLEIGDQVMPKSSRPAQKMKNKEEKNYSIDAIILSPVKIKR